LAAEPEDGSDGAGAFLAREAARCRRLRQRIFDPLFTTNASGVGLGLGLGLPLARETVRESGGTIALECPSGGGTVFVVALPVADSAQVSATLPEP